MRLGKLLASKVWAPCSFPQIEALVSQADIVGYGGAAGGGKTDLLLGAALTQHTNSLICRRQAKQIKGLSKRLVEITKDRRNYNASEKVYKPRSGKWLEFGHMAGSDDWTAYQGFPYDLMAFDEAANFLESQVRTILGWNRSTAPKQRRRVIFAFNPPTSAEGFWIISFFGPWLDQHHPNPAIPGELRWYVMGEDGKDLEVGGPEPVMVKGKLRNPKSRTFIPARVEDNPYLMATDYADTLDALPEPLRSMMRDGDFRAGMEDHVWQVIPTEWVKAAQDRWTAERPQGVKMSALGVDPARGGRDKTILSPRFGTWYGEQKAYPGPTTPDGPAAAGLAMAQVQDGAAIQVDVIGIGSSVYDHLNTAKVHVVAMNASRTDKERDVTDIFEFLNHRAKWIWRMREALDPVKGMNIKLPPDPELLADLCSYRWKPVGGKIQVESKEDIVKRIGRSPDKGDAAIYALEDNKKPEPSQRHTGAGSDAAFLG